MPSDRGARPPCWWHYPLAVFFPFLSVIPVVPVVIVLRDWLDIQFLPGVT